VQDVLLVCSLQRGQHLEADRRCALRAERSLRLQLVMQRSRRQQLRDDPRAAVYLNQVKNLDHVPVGDLGGYPRFPGGVAAGGPLIPGRESVRPDQLLDRHVALDALVAGAPDDPHAAAADDLDEPVPSREQLSGQR
jgi:hypothetical protein